jgi:hypothetical protein
MLLATFASRLLEATPSDDGKLSSSRMAACNRRASISASSRSMVTSRKASSIEICSTRGVRLSRIFMTSREASPYNPCDDGTIISLGHMRIACDMGMAERTPNRRAAYEHDATTPR